MSLPVFPVVILSSNTEHISRVAQKDAILNFGSNRNGSNLVLSVFQDHPVDENFEIYRPGRVLGCQEAILVAKTGKTVKKHTCRRKKTWKCGTESVKFRSPELSFSGICSSRRARTSWRVFSLENKEKQRGNQQQRFFHCFSSWILVGSTYKRLGPS